jgi:hypothetical protein
MDNLSMLEAYYKKFASDISQWLPEDVIEVNLELLKQLNLLNYNETEYHDPTLTRYFHVIESDEKITLINDDFVVWIVPEKMNDTPITYTFIAFNDIKQPQLELCFVTAGVYNTSKLVLRLLEKFLSEVEENQKVLQNLETD